MALTIITYSSTGLFEDRLDNPAIHNVLRPPPLIERLNITAFTSNYRAPKEKSKPHLEVHTCQRRVPIFGVLYSFETDDN
jgi:hypothetical protein